MQDIEQIFKNAYQHYKPESKMWKMVKELEQFYAQKLTKMPSGEREIVRRNQIKDNEASARATTGESWANLSIRY